MCGALPTTRATLRARVASVGVKAKRAPSDGGHDEQDGASSSAFCSERCTFDGATCVAVALRPKGERPPGVTTRPARAAGGHERGALPASTPAEAGGAAAARWDCCFLKKRV
mmetsp:Transcript_19662/g.78259  ORF Transcript_19662/g.78259 Transcript_19662/m.78259 type:complete len:112 (+) Transcript_19662:155-490(+)